MKYKELGKAITFGLLGLGVSFSSVAIESATAQSNSPSIPEIEWDTSLESYQFDNDKFIGQRLTAKCMPSTVNQSYDGVYGTDSYPSDNSLCIAALHAGKITPEGGEVTVQLNPGESSYTGSTRNGVTTSSLPATSRSMAFIDSSASPATKEIHLSYIPRLEWDTKFTATGFANRELVGQRFTFDCPAAPSDFRPRLIYGTDSYAFHSIVCQAAVHAGKITTEGGIVTVQLDPGVNNLVGSIRNGIETKNGQSPDRSISFVESSVTK